MSIRGLLLFILGMLLNFATVAESRIVTFPDVFDPYSFIGVEFSLESRVWMNGTLQVIVEAQNSNPLLYIKLYTWIDPLTHPKMISTPNSYNAAYF